MFSGEAIYMWAGRWLPVLLDAAIKGAVLLGAVFLAAPVLRKRSAAVRQLLWVMVLGVLLVLPLVSQALPGWRVLPSWARWETPAPVNVTAEEPAAAPNPIAEPFELPAETPLPAIEAYPTAAPRIAETPIEIEPPAPLAPAAPIAPQIAAVPEVRPEQTELPSPPVQPVPWLAFIWSVGFLVCLAPLVLGRISLWRLAGGSRRADGSWDETVRRASGALSLRGGVTLLMSHRETMPMVWGVLRAKLLLPAGAINWSSDRRWVVLLHELAHAKRRDCLAKLIAHLACAVYWFNPLCWMAFKRMQREAETACDDLVLTAGEKPSDYAQHLLEIASGLKSGMLAAYSSIALARPSAMENRLRSILDSKRNRRRITIWGLLTATLLITTIAIPLAIMRAATKEAPPTADKVVEEYPDRVGPAKQWAAPTGGLVRQKEAERREAVLANLDKTLAGTTSDADRLSILSDAMRAEPASDIRRVMRDHLRLLSDLSRETLLIEILRDAPDCHLQNYAADRLGEQGSSRAIAPLIAAANSAKKTGGYSGCCFMMNSGIRNSG